jgi:hypothetical protein
MWNLILGWPSDTFSVDFRSCLKVVRHSLQNTYSLVFIPGIQGWWNGIFHVRAASGTIGCFAARGSRMQVFTKSDSAVNVEQWKDSPDRGLPFLGRWTNLSQVRVYGLLFMSSALKKRWGFPERRAATFILFLIRSVCTLQRLFIY